MNDTILNISLAEKAQFVSEIDVFRRLPAQAISDLAQKMKLQDFKPGELIINKGDSGDCMYVILSGNVRIHDEGMVIAEIAKGQYFGEFSLLDNEPRSVSVSSVDTSTLACITQLDFCSVLDANPEITRSVISSLIGRLRERTGQIIGQMKEREATLEKLVDQRTEELQRQKKIVEIKNKEILDSIYYARRHQDAILPDVNEIGAGFSDSFVLYLQKDIVAGDFYWSSSIGDEQIIVAADCTGHGVSGALMSILGISLLDQIINKKGIAKPSEILDELHEAVKSALKQKENHSNDGMDIALCNFNLKSMQMQFAGAYRPLWMFRNKEFFSLHPDKMPIGGLQMQTRTPFTNHAVDIQKGDTIYIFSDGYADQFGGDRNKKLMTRNFRNLLIDMHELPCQLQEEKLRSYLNKWKGNNEQIDDILIIGIRI